MLHLRRQPGDVWVFTLLGRTELTPPAFEFATAHSTNWSSGRLVNVHNFSEARKLLTVVVVVVAVVVVVVVVAAAVAESAASVIGYCVTLWLKS